MTQFTVEIEHIKGEAFHETMRRVQRILIEEGRRKGIEKAGYTRTLSDLVNALRESESNQYVTIVEGRTSGRLSRRTPKSSIPLAIKTPVKELDNYIQDSLPDAIYGKMLNLTPRELALQEALKTQVGVSSKLRVPHMEPEERLLAANIIGSLPTGGYGIEEAAKKQLSATVKQALGDLGIDTASNKGRLLERLQSKPFFNDPTLIANFANMIRAYHDVRENNLHYMQSIVTGMPKTKDAELLTNSILPTPDNILNGATAYLIFDTKQSLNIEDISSFIDAFVRGLLNFEDRLVALKASEKQQQVGRFLAAFDFDRGAAAKALEDATLKAIKTGGDFIDSYLAEIDKNTINAKTRLKEALSKTVEYSERIDASSTPINLADDVKEKQIEKLVEYLVNNNLAFPIKPTAKRLDENLFLLIPLQLPSFENNPIGWDRRWMIATMKIVDEYWPMIYGEDRKVLLSDLLYLIAARAKELFNYDIDVVQMTILALLLTDTRNASRRARSILPKAEKGEPLRSLRVLLRESTIDPPKTSPEGKIFNLQLELAKMRQIEKAKDDDDKRNKETASELLRRIVSYLDNEMEDLIRENFGNNTNKEIGGETKSIIDHTSELKKEIDAKIKKISDAIADDDFEFFDDLKSLPDALNEIQETLEKYKLLKPDIIDETEDLVYQLYVTDPQIFSLTEDEVKELAKEFNVQILKDPKDETKGERDLAEIKSDLHGKRGGARSRRLLRNPPNGKIGHVTAEVVMGVNIVKDIFAFGRDIVGGRSKTIEKKVKQTQDLLMEELHKKGEAIGGNALRNIRIEPFTYGSSNSVLVLLGSADVHNESVKKAKSNPLRNAPFDGAEKLRERAVTALRMFASDWIDVPLKLALKKPPQAFKSDGRPTYEIKLDSSTVPYLTTNPNAVNNEYLDLLYRLFIPMHPTTEKAEEDINNELGKMYNGDMAIFFEYPVRLIYTPNSEVRSNPMEKGRTDSYDSYTLAKSAAVALANKEKETVYLWREGEKVLVSIFFPGHIAPNKVTEINPNPPTKGNSKERKYKGVIIKKVEGGWNVEAYDKTLPTLAKAREFISSKVKGSAKPNQRCIRIISGVQCKGTIVKMNKGPHYRCKDCGAKYKAV